MPETPGTASVADLLKAVHSGQYVIPYFQRGFEWKPSMVCDLFQSILQDYYAGLILLWELPDDQAEAGEWDPVWGVETDSTPQMAVLDGQQRLASLYYAIHNPAKAFPNRKSFYRFYINLDRVLWEDFEDAVDYDYSHRNYRDWATLRKARDEWIETGKVPLCLLSAGHPVTPDKPYVSSREFEQWIGSYLDARRSGLPDGVTTYDVHKALNSIREYRFVYYALGKQRELPDICNIFARVNEKGMKLSTFDLMNAFLYPHGVKLRKDLWENLQAPALKEVDPNMNEYLLKLMSLRLQNYCSAKYLYNLIPGKKTIRKDEEGRKHAEVLVETADQFCSFWREACTGAKKARQRVMNTGKGDFGAVLTDFVPNTTLIPVLGALLMDYDGDPDDARLRKPLWQWYWAAVFSEDYSGSSDTAMSSDFRAWKRWMEDKESLPRVGHIDRDYVEEEIDFLEVSKGSARYNAVLSLLALNGARDFYKGWHAGSVDYTSGSVNDHHIFPKAADLPPEKLTLFQKGRDSILNRTLLYDETNRQIRNRRPSQYIAEMVKKRGSEHEVKRLLRDHLINATAYECMRDDDFDGFVREREKALKKLIVRVLTGEMIGGGEGCAAATGH